MKLPVLAVDLGKTNCRSSLRVDGNEVRTTKSAGSRGLADIDGGPAAYRAIVRIIDETTYPTPPFAVSIGAAGAWSAPNAATELADRLVELDSVAAVAVTSDAVTAHVGALGGNPGVVLTVGTGVVATAVDGGGELVRVDGWGPLLGDEGGGAWIGLAGLRAALRSFDGRGPDTELAGEAIEEYGIPLSDLPYYLGRHDNPPLLTARFAPVVAAAAETDSVAAAIMSEAARALAATVLSAAERSGLRSPVPCAIIGGLINLGAPLLDPLDAAIAHRVERRDPLGGSIDGAALLAVDTATAVEKLVIRRADNY
ncbi:N-acetylglucosamine kinase [Nocardia pseudobrasiliensis]|uniref:N-acetylglucosamine kinase-like BadF-type ATPase n=1 Tax=Nocardia pseudobrasiliensis TaxID=45979 RepID=A0A370II35_9NOCA|nr:BadF/BadG/BcrA/BcrD ATPase family protein [Nocardia pseudobrasiliensis]RDI69134.1 N-acetylglucosamine kinase-like BadF-type ATPase [Nocardia pseudobrasiliensis]